MHWLYPATSAAPADAVIARQLVAQRDAHDRHLLALVYGYGLDLGLAAWTLDLDPALAHWRLRATLEGESLERGVAAMLRRADGPSDEARALLEDLPDEARARLQSALDGTRVSAAAAAEGTRPGLGVGSLVIVLLAIAAFLLYGVIRDRNPLRHGKDLVRRGDFATARLVLEELGTLPEARVYTAFTWLAEGDFGRAFEALQSPGAGSHLAMFRPFEESLEVREVDPASRALLPRGLITATQPALVFRSGPGGEIVLLGRPIDGSSEPFRPVRIRVPESGDGSQVIVMSWPAGLGELAPGDYTWTVPGSELHGGAFSLLPDDQRIELDSHVADRLSNDIPYPAIVFLRAHFYLRNKLYMQAGLNFATLARRFPEQAYPREMIAQVAAALGVDPSAFVR